MEKSYNFKKVSTLGVWIKKLFGLWAFIEVFALLFSFMQYQLLTQDIITTEKANASEVRLMVIGVVELFVSLSASSLFLIWVYRVNVNVCVMGAVGLKISPGWAVGFFFIPILNLWKPYQAMNEVWWASSDPIDWEQKKNQESSVVGKWWFFWLITLFGDNASKQFWEKANVVSVMQNLSLLDVVISMLTIFSCYTTFVMVEHITEIQTHVQSRMQDDY